MRPRPTSFSSALTVPMYAVGVSPPTIPTIIICSLPLPLPLPLSPSAPSARFLQPLSLHHERQVFLFPIPSFNLVHHSVKGYPKRVFLVSFFWHRESEVSHRIHSARGTALYTLRPAHFHPVFPTHLEQNPSTSRALCATYRASLTYFDPTYSNNCRYRPTTTPIEFIDLVIANKIPQKGSA